MPFAFARMLGLQEFSSVGRASVSKTEGRGFESPNSCHFFYLYAQSPALPLKRSQIRLPFAESMIMALVFPK
jgi:hypothetical protein